MAFGLITGDEAAAHLSDRTFSEHRVGCELDGRYANLNFGHLKLLALLEPLTPDAERFVIAKFVIEVAERPDADGLSVFSGHLVALNHIQRSPRRVLRHARREVRFAR